MLTAIRDIDKIKVVGDLITKNTHDIYFCDYCKRQVIHHKSDARLKIGHFKHKAANDCPNNSTGESEVHLKMKTQIYNRLLNDSRIKNVELEKWLTNNQLRADVFLETFDGEQAAIEVQVSNLTTDQIASRNMLYDFNDIAVHWVLPFDQLIRWVFYQKFKFPNKQITYKLPAYMRHILQEDGFLTFWNYDDLSWPIIRAYFQDYQYYNEFTKKHIIATTKKLVSKFMTFNTADELLFLVDLGDYNGMEDF